MRFLIDTNVWLELLLAQARASETETFIKRTPITDLAISDFSLHSIGIILAAKQQAAAYKSFLPSFAEPNGVSVIRIDPPGLIDVISAIQQFKLDFDDAYQCVIAEKYGLEIISFDAHFDKTPRGRKTPAEAM